MTNQPATRTIEVRVSPTGSVTISTRGFSGASCRDATRELEQALGATASEVLQPEYFANRQSSVEDQLRQGT